MVVGCHDDNGVRLALNAGSETVKEIFAFSCDGRHYNRHITREESRSFRKRYRREGP